jgi:1,4-alpha-glucan branching enzyme
MNELPTATTATGDFPFTVGSNYYSAKKNVKPVNFYCIAPNAKTVCLAGDFNGWNPSANPMKRDPIGSWTACVELHHGHHQYLFFVDGEPMLDSNAYGIARNERNERVSLVAVS